MDTISWFPIAGIISAGALMVIALYVLVIRFVPSLKLPGTAYASKKKDAMAIAGVALVAIALLGGGWTEIQGWMGGGAAPAPAPSPGPGVVPTGCPTTGYTAVKMDIQNKLNTASLEEFDATVTCVGPSDVVTISDTTDPNTTNFVCGDTYTCYLTSTAGAAGDGSSVQSILSGTGSISNGQLVFTASGAAQSFQLEVMQLGVTQARLWDVKNAAWIYDSGDATATDYETDGATFKSSTGNTTNMSIGTAGEVHVQMSFRSTAVDNALNDGRGLLFAIDAAVAKWEQPTVKLNGAVLSDCKDSLNANEKLALSGYEYVYCYSGANTFQQTAEGILDVQIFALAGVDPGVSDDIEIDLIPRGQKASALDASSFIQSAYDDTASHTVILQVDDYKIDIA